MSTDEMYLRKVAKIKGILKYINCDIDSWQGAPKKELTLKLKECSHFLQKCNASSIDQATLSFVRHFMDDVDSFERDTNMKLKLAFSQKVLNRAEELNESMKRSCKYNSNLLDSAKLSELSDSLEKVSLQDDDIQIMEDVPTLLMHERINELLNKLEEQEKEIEKLSSLVKTVMTHNN